MPSLSSRSLEIVGSEEFMWKLLYNVIIDKSVRKIAIDEEHYATFFEMQCFDRPTDSSTRPTMLIKNTIGSIKDSVRDVQMNV